MFQQIKNIDTAFRQLRIFSLLVILANIGFTCFYTYRSDQRVYRAENRVLILLNGKVINAMTSSRKDNLEVEARDHVATFHQLFFSLSPDDKVIKEHISKALYLADQSAKHAYDNLEEKGYYANLIAGNINQSLQVDSINIDTKSYPYHFRCYATQQIIRQTSQLSRTLITSGQLKEVIRSDNNPHGFLIEHWNTLENKNL
ncbi:conjugative transposon protein TraK [Pedobacter foliorum]|uniref:conjugative transposon protein TraK n=1 Tax=Pedobacter foliorum TaxID=2739058 RepID=UPI001564225D|nr:conjugative transposon protein TraK [Pedobacter foliorum]NRF41100.1 conjugative transposon protein TraK [Pedobacter foliorum]